MSEAISAVLPVEPESSRRAREELQRFRRFLDEMSFMDLRLVVSELVAEALRAAADPLGMNIELHAELRRGRIRVEIADGGNAYQLPSRRPGPGEAGFGLHLMQSLANRWGIRRQAAKATVWLEILTDSDRSIRGTPILQGG